MTGHAAPRLESARLLLCPIVPEDDAALHALFCDPFVHRHLFDGRPPAAAESAALLASCRAAFHERQLPLCTVRFPDGALAGFCGFKPEPERGVPELVFGLSPRFVGRGLATELAALGEGMSPWLMLSLVILITSVATEALSNNAIAVLFTPAVATAMPSAMVEPPHARSSPESAATIDG